jgi:hypothetical protein
MPADGFGKNRIGRTCKDFESLVVHSLLAVIAALRRNTSYIRKVWAWRPEGRRYKLEIQSAERR